MGRMQSATARRCTWGRRGAAALLVRPCTRAPPVCLWGEVLQRAPSWGRCGEGGAPSGKGGVFPYFSCWKKRVLSTRGLVGRVQGWISGQILKPRFSSPLCSFQNLTSSTASTASCTAPTGLRLRWVSPRFGCGKGIPLAGAAPPTQRASPLQPEAPSLQIRNAQGVKRKKNKGRGPACHSGLQEDLKAKMRVPTSVAWSCPPPF